jgi:hypothetical protein
VVGVSGLSGHAVAPLIQRLKATFHICINRPNRRTETQVAVLGHARVSTQARDLEPQLRQLRAAGCTEIFEEAFGTSRAWPELTRLLNRLRAGDTLVLVRIDRLTRSLPPCSQLLSACARLTDHPACWYCRSWAPSRGSSER